MSNGRVELTRRQWLAGGVLALGLPARPAWALETIRQGFQTNIWACPPIDAAVGAAGRELDLRRHLGGDAELREHAHDVGRGNAAAGGRGVGDGFCRKQRAPE